MFHTKFYFLLVLTSEVILVKNGRFIEPEIIGSPGLCGSTVEKAL
jgi:hypothetical protein